MSDIHTAVERGRSSQVEEILGSDPAAVHLRNELANQPLHLAARHGRAALVTMLLEAGADINARGDRGQTALHYAAASQRKKVVTLLLEQGADAGIEDDLGNTPLYLAASTEDRAMSNALLRRNAPIDPLSAIYLEGPAVVLERLRGGNEPADSMRTQRMLWDAVRVGSVDLVEHLLGKGANPNDSRVDGLAPLFHAISYGHSEIVRLLLDRGADVGAKDHVGGTVLSFCDIYGAVPEIKSLLMEHGAK